MEGDGLVYIHLFDFDMHEQFFSKGEISYRLLSHWILDNNGLEVFSCR
jgi:hypothetical protein